MPKHIDDPAQAREVTADHITMLSRTATRLMEVVARGEIDPYTANSLLERLTQGRPVLDDHDLKVRLSQVYRRGPGDMYAPAFGLLGRSDYSSIPNPPRFEPHSDTELLCLHIPFNFEKLWSACVEAAHYGMEYRQSTDWRRSALGATYGGKPTWVAIDPFGYRGSLANMRSKGLLPAGLEGLSLLLMMPDWPLAWRGNAYDVGNRFWLAGVEGTRNNDDGWNKTPVLSFSKDRVLSLGSECLGYPLENEYIPTVRPLVSG